MNTILLVLLAVVIVSKMMQMMEMRDKARVAIRVRKDKH